MLLYVCMVFFHCKEAAVLCNGLCGNHDADHAIFQSLSRDKAIDKTIEHAHEIGMFRDRKMCQACLSEYWLCDKIYAHITKFGPETSEPRSMDRRSKHPWLTT